jgi:hypothetical protein
MKNVKLFVILAIVSMAFASCKKDDDKSSDARDKFVGSYTYTLKGKTVVSMLGEEEEEPISESGIFIIEKANAENKILIKENGEVTEAVVSGNSFTYTETLAEDLGNGIALSGNGTITGTINGSTLTVEIKGNGNLIGAVSGSYTMNATMIATKK